MAKAKAVQADNDAPAAGHNSEQEETLFFISRNAYVKALDAKKAADAAFKNVCKTVKADLGEHGVDQIKLYEQSRTPEGEAKAKAKLEADMKVFRWAKIPIGTQFDLLENDTDLEDRAYHDGLESGLRGETLDNPFGKGTESHDRFETGWRAGQKRLAAGITKTELIKGGGSDPDFPNEDEGARVAAE